MYLVTGGLLQGLFDKQVARMESDVKDWGKSSRTRAALYPTETCVEPPQ